MTLLFKIHEKESPNYKVYADDHKELFVIGVEFINDFENDEKAWAWVEKNPEEKGIFSYSLIKYLSEMPDDYAHGPTSHNYIDAILAAYPDNIKHIFKTMKCNIVLKNLENMNSDYGKKHFF